MTIDIDPEGVETTLLNRLVDFTGREVLEVGCGNGRMTRRYAAQAASVLAVDPDHEAIESARADTPAAIRKKVEFQVADICEIELPPGAYDIAVFAMSI